MKKITVSIFATALAFVALGHAQSSPLTFEVASIKLSPGCETKPRSGQGVSPGRLNLECMTLQALIENAYGVWANAASPNIKHPDMRGGPGWVSSDYYAILAAADGNPSRGQMNGFSKKDST
jgi:uncharacterized protein (TIGR03435 family)